MIRREIAITFYDAKECVPARNGDYLCYIDSGGGYYTSLYWSAEGHGWNIKCDDGSRKSEMFPAAWAVEPDLGKKEDIFA